MPRDFSKPYTDEELEGLKAGFRTLPTYKPGGWILTKDIPQLITQILDYPRTPAQIQAYVDYWNRKFGGVVTLETFIESAHQLHTTPGYAAEYVRRVDANGDGFIQRTEFIELMKLIKVHDPEFETVSYPDFVQQADFNKDGAVSIEECVDWLEVTLKK